MLEEQDGLCVVEQLTGNGTFRWLLSQCSGDRILAETIVQCLPGKRTRSGTQVIDRTVLIPRYHAAMVAGLALRFGPLKRLLLLGIGGGALAMFIRRTYPQVLLTCVDSSRSAIDLGQRHFGLQPGKHLKIVVCSAETFLRTLEPSVLFDAILVDTSFSGPHDGMCAPHPSLCRRRAIRELAGRLTPFGVLIVNALGEDTSMHHFEHVFMNSCAGCAMYRFDTAEGNVVIAACTTHLNSRSTREASMFDVWQAHCESLGLDVYYWSHAHQHDNEMPLTKKKRPGWTKYNGLAFLLP